MSLYYNENGDLQEYGEWNKIVICPKCNKPYRQYCEEQVPGFRDKSYDICPYCGADNGSSMDEDYMNYKLAENEITEYLEKRKTN